MMRVSGANMATTRSVNSCAPKVPEKQLLDDMATDVEAEDARPQPLQEALEQRDREDVEQRRKLSQWAMTVSLLPFAFTGLVNPSAWIGYVVLVLGVLSHGGSALNWGCAKYASFVDTVCNFVFGIYVNVQWVWQPWTLLLTGVSLLAYLANGHYEKVKYTSVHIVFVQWLLCFLLYMFEWKR